MTTESIEEYDRRIRVERQKRIAEQLERDATSVDFYRWMSKRIGYVLDLVPDLISEIEDLNRDVINLRLALQEKQPLYSRRDLEKELEYAITEIKRLRKEKDTPMEKTVRTPKQQELHELRIKVAELTGWKIELYNGKYRVTKSPDAVHVGWEHFEDDMPYDVRYGCLPNWPVHFDEVRFLLPNPRNDGYYYEIANDALGVFVTLINKKNDDNICVFGTTIPEAISRSFVVRKRGWK